MAKKRPWIQGLIDGISASNLVKLSTISYRNRIAFIILDSTLEMAYSSFFEIFAEIVGIDYGRSSSIDMNR